MPHPPSPLPGKNNAHEPGAAEVVEPLPHGHGSVMLIAYGAVALSGFIIGVLAGLAIGWALWG